MSTDSESSGLQGSNSSTRYFVNGVGIGLDAEVAHRKSKFRYLPGDLPYLVSVFDTLWRYKPVRFDVTVDGVSRISRDLLVAVGNGRCVGGRFHLTPDAILHDGVLNTCIIEEMPLLKILRLVPYVVRGDHASVSGVHFLKGKEISVSSDTGFSVHADGEVLGRSIRTVRVDVVERKLNIISGTGR
jgi:diacylglycerol kinase family enzyme